MSRCKTCLFALALIICATPSFAGTLASATSYLGIWNGSTPFTDGANLNGTVEWAVFAPGTFPAGFLGYTPSPSNLVYAYQIFEVGSDPLSLLNVGVGGPALNIGTFTGLGVSGQSALTTTLISGSLASWTFGGIAGPGTSVGLAYESPNVPANNLGVVQNGASVAAAVPLPSPSLTPIPEPATLTMALVGFLGFIGLLLRRRVCR